MTRLYVYTTVEGFEGSWDEAEQVERIELA